MTLIRVHPSPPCPKCGGRMVLRRPKPMDTWKAFWSCSLWRPDGEGCDGTRKPVAKAEGQFTLFPEEGVRYENV